MISPYVRLSRRQFRREGQPLAPDLKVAGKNTDAFRRFVFAQVPPFSAFEGTVSRREGISKDIIFLTRIEILTQFVRAQTPPFSEFEGRTLRREGKAPEFLRFSQKLTGLYRVADISKDLFELYKGLDANPDFTASPDETSATLPFSHDVTADLPVSGTKEFRLTIRDRNEHDLLSINQFFRSFILDSAGNEVKPNPSTPINVTLSNIASLNVLVNAKYLASNDEPNQADQWLVFSRSNGTDPDPTSDTPVIVNMIEPSGFKQLAEEIGPFVTGNDVRVLVRARRSSDTKDSTNLTATTIIIPAVPAGPKGQAFGQDQHELR